MDALRARLRPVVLATALIAGTAVVMVAPVDAADAPPFVLGSASASGSVARAKLFYGGLTLPLGVGTTSASYTNQQSKALGVALDLGAYVGLAGDVPPQFQPTVIDSNSGDKEANGNLEAGEAVARLNLKATKVPSSSSEIRMADLDLPALVRVEGGHALSMTSVHEGKQRRASSLVEVAQVTIANGLVVLNNLRWEATTRSGFEPAGDAKFSIGSAAIAGLAVPITAADGNAGLAPLNAALKPVGLRLEAPKLNKTAEGVAMGPLRVGLADSQLGAQLLGPIIASARPILAPIFEATTDANKSLGLVGLVADIVLGVADGSGGAEVSLGGASASTTAVGFVAPATLSAPRESVAFPDVTLGGSSPIAGLPESLAPQSDSVLDSPTIASTESVRCALEAAPRRKGDCRNGNLVVAIAISAVAILAVAGAEIGVRRRRRQDAAEVIA